MLRATLSGALRPALGLAVSPPRADVGEAGPLPPSGGYARLLMPGRLVEPPPVSVPAEAWRQGHICPPPTVGQTATNSARRYSRGHTALVSPGRRGNTRVPIRPLGGTSTKSCSRGATYQRPAAQDPATSRHAPLSPRARRNPNMEPHMQSAQAAQSADRSRCPWGPTNSGRATSNQNV